MLIGVVQTLLFLEIILKQSFTINEWLLFEVDVSGTEVSGLGEQVLCFWALAGLEEAKASRAIFWPHGRGYCVQATE
jgi:hypothetical protein